MKTVARKYFLFLALLLAVTISAGADTDPVLAKAATDPIFERISVIGASVSAGFGAPRIAETLQIALPASTVNDHAELAMFQDVMTIGKAQIDATIKAKPTFVLAIDFLFWFAYIDSNKAGREMSLELGLAELDRLDAPLAVGDLPDMRSANPRMLPRRLVPSSTELEALNARIKQWATCRKRTVLLSLSQWSAPLQNGESIELVAGEVVPAKDLLFFDGLHLNQLGLWYMLDRTDRVLETKFKIAAETLSFVKPW